MIFEAPLRELRYVKVPLRFLKCVAYIHLVCALVVLLSPAPGVSLMSGLIVLTTFRALHDRVPENYIVLASMSIMLMFPLVCRLIVECRLPNFGYSKAANALEFMEALSQLRVYPSELVDVAISQQVNPLSDIIAPLAFGVRPPSPLFPSLVPAAVENSSKRVQLSDLPYQPNSFARRVPVFARGESNSERLRGIRISNQKPLPLLHVTAKSLEEFLNFYPAQWRVYTEVGCLFISTICSALTSILSGLIYSKLRKRLTHNVTAALERVLPLATPPNETTPLVTTVICRHNAGSDLGSRCSDEYSDTAADSEDSNCSSVYPASLENTHNDVNDGTEVNKSESKITEKGAGEDGVKSLPPRFDLEGLYSASTRAPVVPFSGVSQTAADIRGAGQTGPSTVPPDITIDVRMNSEDDHNIDKGTKDGITDVTDKSSGSSKDL